MKRRLFSNHLSALLILCSLMLVSPSLTSCKSSKKKAGEDPAEQKKKKPKKCPDPSCKVRMTHYHEGGKYKGKRGCFIVKMLTPKESKYGQGKYRNHGNPGRSKHRRRR